MKFIQRSEAYLPMTSIKKKKKKGPLSPSLRTATLDSRSRLAFQVALIK